MDPPPGDAYRTGEGQGGISPGTLVAGNWSPPNLDPLFEDLPHGQHDDDSIPVDFICSLPNGVIVQSPPTHRRQEESSSQSSTSSTGASQLVGVRKKTVQWIPATGQFEVNQGCAVRLAELPPLPPSVAEPQKTSLTLSVHHADPKYSDPVRACESESCDSCCKKQQEVNLHVFRIVEPKNAEYFIDASGNFCARVQLEGKEDANLPIVILKCISQKCANGSTESGRRWKLRVVRALSGVGTVSTEDVSDSNNSSKAEINLQVVKTWRAVENRHKRQNQAQPNTPAAKKSKALRKCISALREAAEYMSVDDIDEKTNSLKVIISENGSTSTEST